MLLTPAALWLVKGRLFRAPPILALKNPGWTTVFRWQRKSAQALFMLFMTMPTIAETIAPDTPPPTSWPASAPMSMPPVAPCSMGMSEVRSDPPATPPTAPAMVLPAVPRFTFLAAAPTALPPIAPAISWMMRLIIVPDMVSSCQNPVGRCVRRRNRLAGFNIAPESRRGLAPSQIGFPVTALLVGALPPRPGRQVWRQR